MSGLIFFLNPGCIPCKLHPKICEYLLDLLLCFAESTTKIFGVEMLNTWNGSKPVKSCNNLNPHFAVSTRKVY